LRTALQNWHYLRLRAVADHAVGSLRQGALKLVGGAVEFGVEDVEPPVTAHATHGRRKPVQDVAAGCVGKSQ
jgi:hypothetical protein